MMKSELDENQSEGNNDQHIFHGTDMVVPESIPLPLPLISKDTNNNNNNCELSYDCHNQQQHDDIYLAKSGNNPLIIYVVPPEDCSNSSNNDINDNYKPMKGSIKGRHYLSQNEFRHQPQRQPIKKMDTQLQQNGNNCNITNNNDRRNISKSLCKNDSNNINTSVLNQHKDENDGRSLDTTTSEVNSNDDAESIVSRLSMIVTEQEENMNHHQHHHDQRTIFDKGEDKKHKDNDSDTFKHGHSLDCCNYSEEIPIAQDNSQFDSDIDKPSVDTTADSCRITIQRPRSFTITTVDSVCKNCLSPRDSKNLKTVENQQIDQHRHSNIIIGNNSSDKLTINNHHDSSVDNMLTITRSTWTLSEFDRIFPKVTSKERKRSADLSNVNQLNVNYEPNVSPGAGANNLNKFQQVDLGSGGASPSVGRRLSGNHQQVGAYKKHSAFSNDYNDTIDSNAQMARNRSGTDVSQDTMVSNNNNTCNGCLPSDNKSSRWARKSFTRYVPAIEWLISYDYKQWLVGDIMAGLVVASLNISLCLAAALLADVDASVAFRSSIVNTFVYSIFCTSRHTSFGAYSIMALMASVTVQRAMNDEMVMIRLELGPSAFMSKEEYDLWRYKIMIFYTFLTGLVQLVGGLLGLGTLVASFIPEALCSSMLASTAITMSVGQLANMCGLNYNTLYKLHTGDSSQVMGSTFKWCHQLLLLFENLNSINYVCLGLSLTSMALLFANNYVFQRTLEKIFKRKILIPFELLILVLSTVVSYAWKLKQDYQVETSGPVRITFDLPTMPDLRLIQELWLDALVAGLISFTLTVTLAKLLAQKLNYELDSNQELIACGLGNITGGLFDALPASGTAIRSTTQVAVGGKTQLASMVNCVVLIMLAQTCGDLISPLPRCVMASILCYGFIRIISQTRDAFKYWRICKVDFSIWLVGFVAILSFDLIYGFVVSIIYSILTILYRAQNRRAYLLGSIDSSDVYVPINKYPSAAKIEGIEIYQYCGSLHYACSELFEQKLRQQTGVKVKQIRKQLELNNLSTAIKKISPFAIDKHNLHRELNIPTHIILDFSMISFVDSSGVFTMKKIIEEYQSVNIIVLFASLATHVAATVRSEPSLWDVYHSRFYVTLSDAVHNALRQRSSAFV